MTVPFRIGVMHVSDTASGLVDAMAFTDSSRADRPKLGNPRWALGKRCERIGADLAQVSLDTIQCLTPNCRSHR